MGLIPKIRVDEYFYELPDDRIALFPASPKDSAKCLVYDGASILDCNFQSLPNYFEKDSNFVINNTEVIPARIWFTTKSGVSIQIFLLKMLDQSAHIWEVMVGNRRRFKEGNTLLLEDTKFNLVCKWKDRERNIIELESNQSVMSAIEHFGKVPLPPYIVREVKESDKGDYQTVFAKEKGAVAAPTASLHFTEDLISSIKNKGINMVPLTLHVSAGTFKPVSAEYADEHEMHAEQFEVEASTIKLLIELKKGITAVGTTSCRLLESLYFLGAKLLRDGSLEDVFVSSQDGYDQSLLKYSPNETLVALLSEVEKRGGKLRGETQIFMVPGFEFHFTQWLITNFHQPSSTLLMLISAFVGEKWKEIYQWALDKNYRFLSYGDGSFLRGKKIISK